MNREQEEREEEEEEEEREEEETEAENYGDPTIPPDTQIDQYTIETLLLKPGNSEVYQCSSFDNDVKLVCKLIHKNVHLSELEAETRALTSLRHPFFMNLVDIKDFPDFRLLFFERYTEGDFLEYIRRSCKKRKIISENFLARFFFLLAVGFSHMHNSRFMHRDIKPENILIQTRRRLDNTH